RRALGQLVLIAIGIAPVTAAVSLLPVLGVMLVKIVAATWALHWVVIDALDSARTLGPGETLADVDQRSQAAPSPWFARALRALTRPLPGPLRSAGGGF